MRSARTTKRSTRHADEWRYDLFPAFIEARTRLGAEYLGALFQISGARFLAIAQATRDDALFARALEIGNARLATAAGTALADLEAYEESMGADAPPATLEAYLYANGYVSTAPTTDANIIGSRA